MSPLFGTNLRSARTEMGVGPAVTPEALMGLRANVVSLSARLTYAAEANDQDRFLGSTSIPRAQETLIKPTGAANDLGQLVRSEVTLDSTGYEPLKMEPVDSFERPIVDGIAEALEEPVARVIGLNPAALARNLVNDAYEEAA